MFYGRWIKTARAILNWLQISSIICAIIYKDWRIAALWIGIVTIIKIGIWLFYTRKFLIGIKNETITEDNIDDMFRKN